MWCALPATASALYVARRDVLVGETDITCDFSRLPALDELDPEGSYLNWTIELRTVHDETSVREVFEFVEWDCELVVEPAAQCRGQITRPWMISLKKSKRPSKPGLQRVKYHQPP